MERVAAVAGPERIIERVSALRADDFRRNAFEKVAKLPSGDPRRKRWVFVFRVLRRVDRAGCQVDDRDMYHYDPDLALEELAEDAVLPHPSLLRDMIVRAALPPERVIEANRQFQNYIQRFGELQNIVRPILQELARAKHPGVHRA